MWPASQYRRNRVPLTNHIGRACKIFRSFTVDPSGLHVPVLRELAETLLRLAWGGDRGPARAHGNIRGVIPRIGGSDIGHSRHLEDAFIAIWRSGAGVGERKVRVDQGCAGVSLGQSAQDPVAGSLCQADGNLG